MSDVGVLLALWLIASVAAIGCCLRALHHIRKTRESLDRAIKISEGMQRTIGEMQSAVRELRP